MINNILKRDGRVEEFNQEKIAEAIFKAAKACGGDNRELANELAARVVNMANALYGDGVPTVENIQDLVEQALINEGHAQTAKAYILYREKRREERERRNKKTGE